MEQDFAARLQERTRPFPTSQRRWTPSFTGLATALLFNGEDRFRGDFEPGFRYRVTTRIGETVSALVDLLQRPLDIADALVVHVVQRLVDLVLRHALRLVLELVRFVAVLLLGCSL